ncbi:MAG: glycosyl hydrolase family 8, partial [Bacteroidales bacterium]
MKTLHFFLFLILSSLFFIGVCSDNQTSMQSSSKAKYPFPQNVNYKYGIRVSKPANDKIQEHYIDWLTRFYEEHPTDPTLARIKFDDPQYTVSEGIAYGMLIFVYMDNEKNNTQPKFDKIWNYFKLHSKSIHGLMSWRILGWDSVTDPNSATDAELDIAMTLLMAHKQWGSNGAVNYLEEAKELIRKIWLYEIKDGKIIKPSDAWEDFTSPSYFLTASLETFKYVDKEHAWDSVIVNCYRMLRKGRHPETGLVSDWVYLDGSVVTKDNRDRFHYDAARTPWRTSMAYSWFGHEDAKEFSSKITEWVTAKYKNKWKCFLCNHNYVKSSYALDGSTTSTYG